MKSSSWFRLFAAHPGSSRDKELLISVAIAIALILFRSYVPTVFERFDFDSDQAIVGLMAKHLSELRAFPLFFYGQNYMLGVQSWIAVPFFWVGGPSLAMLRAPLILLNALVAIVIIVSFARQGMTPRVALAATLPLVVTTPIVSASLVEALGVSVEPLAYALLLWFVRHRPALFGAVFCATFFHREFAAFSVVAIGIVRWIEWKRDPSSTPLLRPAALARAAASFAAGWLLIDVLKRIVNVGPTGPAGATYQGGSLIFQARQLLNLLSLDPHYYVSHLAQLISQGLPEMMGAREHSIRSYGMISTIDAGSAVAGAAIGAALAICAWRLLRHAEAARPRDHQFPFGFTLYLGLVGLQSVLAYGLKTGMSTDVGVVVNYVLLALFVPVALFGAFFSLEPSTRYRRAVACLICFWASLTVIDNVRLLREYVVSPPENSFREMADYLVAHRVRYGRARYWDAYVVTFMSRERVILASTDKVRIPAYQARVDANAENAVTLYRQPCGGGTIVSGWCIVDPLNR